MPGPDRPSGHRRTGSLTDADFPSANRTRQFHNLVYTVAQLMRTPIAALYLVDPTSLRAKARVGPILATYPPDHPLLTRLVAAGPTAFHDPDPDPRLAVHAAALAPEPVRALVATPIAASAAGSPAFGLLCAMDLRPRTFTDAQIATFHRLATTARDLLIDPPLGPARR